MRRDYEKQIKQMHYEYCKAHKKCENCALIEDDGQMPESCLNVSFYKTGASDSIVQFLQRFESDLKGFMPTDKAEHIIYRARTVVERMQVEKNDGRRTD